MSETQGCYKSYPDENKEEILSTIAKENLKLKGVYFK